MKSVPSVWQPFAKRLAVRKGQCLLMQVYLWMFYGDGHGECLIISGGRVVALCGWGLIAAVTDVRLPALVSSNSGYRW